ncbi:EexN family lipoprotein [Agrobacterium leguminum]|uniref:EexN family lipoprotein n=1 Tax=Agrobacterium leguminum TaxID=2792015 RepID=UPI003CE59662
MRWFVSALAMLLLSACSSEEKVYTVDELVADEALLTKIIGECRNNPGELRDTANCRNGECRNNPGELRDTANCRNAEAADGRLRLERMRKSLGG